jgi:hypothetical protein
MTPVKAVICVGLLLLFARAGLAGAATAATKVVIAYSSLNEHG